MKSKYSEHCQRRMAQRAIPEALMNLLLVYGEGRFQKGGTEVVELDDVAVQQALKAMKQLSRLLSNDRPYYAIVSADGTVITAGRKYKKQRVIH